MKIRDIFDARVGVLSLCVALLLTGAGCATGALKIATAASAGAQSALIMAADAEQEGFSRGLLTNDQHVALVQRLQKAVNIHADAVKLILTAPKKEDGSPMIPLGEYAAMVAPALALIQDVIDALPASAAKTQAAALTKKGLF